jgi:hypothetical protein
MALRIHKRLFPLAILLICIASTFQFLRKTLGDMQTPDDLQTLHDLLPPAQEEPQDSAHGSSTLSMTASLPSCLELMRQPGSPYATGDFITQSTTPYTWNLRADGSREFDLAAYCTLHRYTATEAHQCLANKHIMFVGDSLTRFQMTSLAYFLEKGIHPPRFERAPKGQPCPHVNYKGEAACSPENEPNVANSDDFEWMPFPNSWGSFHHKIGGALDGDVFQGRMECDCSRAGVNCPQDQKGCDVENYIYATASEKDRILLTFFFEAGWGSQPRPLRGFHFTGCAFTGSCRRDQNVTDWKVRRSQNIDYNWIQSLGDALEANGTFRTHLPKVHVSLYNRGLWGGLTTAQAQNRLPLFYNLTGREKGACFFKSTTASSRTSPGSLLHEQGILRDETNKAGCSFLDFAHVTGEFGKLAAKDAAPSVVQERKTIYADEIHFRPWVNEEFNNILLNVLCNANILTDLDKKRVGDHLLTF